ncbi:hypothetical protein M405DRAFT_936001 [Rhizopogon salebrosus TDB-379]|nr:hypothetical protein M405DRAFT_936001 [Rhizopogon salebrosus TDB-379]
MAAQLAPVAHSPVYRSTRQISIFASPPDVRIQDIGPITHYSPASATRSPLPPKRILHSNPAPRVAHAHTSNITLHNAFPHPLLHLQIVYAHNPTLAFIGATLAWPGTIHVPAIPEESLIYEQTRSLGQDDLSYAQAIRRNIVGIHPELGEVLTKWDDAQDTGRWAMYAAKPVCMCFYEHWR